MPAPPPPPSTTTGPPPGHPALPLRVVVMGVSGCGKSSLGQRLAEALDCRYLEGDQLHPPRNVALMAAGVPLTDHDRSDWLAAVAAALGQAHHTGAGLVVGCSALKRRYRDQLRAAGPGLRWVHLQGSRALLEARMRQRSGHYMPPSLLDSQLATLEPPGADEAAITLDIAQPLDALVMAALAQLRTAPHPLPAMPATP